MKSLSTNEKPAQSVNGLEAVEAPLLASRAAWLRRGRRLEPAHELEGQPRAPTTFRHIEASEAPAGRPSLDRRALDAEQHQARHLTAREVDRLARREAALAEEAEPAPRAVGHEYGPGPALDGLGAH